MPELEKEKGFSVHYSTAQARKIRETFQAGEVLSVADAAWNGREEWVWMGEMSSESKRQEELPSRAPSCWGLP